MRIFAGFIVAAGALWAQPTQAVNPLQQPPVTAADTPIFRVNVVARTTKAINYNHRGSSTMVGLQGTALMPEAKGKAEVESKQGLIKIDASMSNLSPASRYGPEYLTYVMWAITPEGRATNLGEILLDGDDSKLKATSELQSFGLIVTAEPYFAVTQPSDVVVMENFVRKDTEGRIEEVDAKYELLPRGQYTLNSNARDLKPVQMDKKVPLELHEARNAVRIARWAGADRYAAETFRKAEGGLQTAEGYLIGKKGKKPIGTVAREATQMAEDARIITIKKLQEESLARERADAAAREAKAQADAANAARDQRLEEERRARAEAERTIAQIEADRARLQAENARATADQAVRDTAEAERARNAALADAARAKAEAQAAVERTAQEKVELERAQQDALRAQALAKAEADSARQEALEANRQRLQAESEKENLRAQLLRQFNVILETRDSARGLIVNLSDVLFDTAQYSLKAGAREKLAKVSGILGAHPGLKVEVEGHTDSVGSDSYNQRLSEQRSEAVRDFLVQQGLPSSSITAKGFGESSPVTSNDTAAGRQQNRRVELIVSGEILGNPLRSDSR